MTGASIPPPPGSLAPRKESASLWRSARNVAIVVVLFFLLLFAIHPPVALRQRKAGDRTEAINKAKQIGLALLEFDSEFGRFPDASTAPEVAKATSTPLTLGSDSSNQLFRQLFAAGLKYEGLFYVRTASSRKPDEKFSDNAHTLSSGECGFAYISGLSASSDPSAPVVLSPMIPGTLTFDPKPFDGKAVVLYVDHSVRTWPIGPDGHVKTSDGRDIFDPLQPCWNGKPPDLKWQE